MMTALCLQTLSPLTESLSSKYIVLGARVHATYGGHGFRGFVNWKNGGFIYVLSIPGHYKGD